jgi:hypothetical protein
MSLLKIIGLNDYTQTSTRREYTQELGQTTVTTYKGPPEPISDLYDTSVLSVQNGEIDAVSTNVENGEGVLEIKVADGNEDGDDPNTIANNTIWELIGQDIFKNIRSYPGDVADSKAFNTDSLQDEMEDVRLYFETAQQEGTAPAIGSAEEVYYNLLLRGTDQYVRSTAVLRTTLTVSRRSLLSLNWVGVDRAWKLNGDGDAESGSPDLNQTGQGALIGQISLLPGFDGDKKQWLKRAPQLTQSGRRNYTMTQEWWYAEAWSTNLYGGTVDATGGNP